jgi:5,10-methylene-tetrahydrofolate dehydrogenase/methenyl tetrahydrofolate cyclohydrolase
MTATILDGHATQVAIFDAELLGVIDDLTADPAGEGYLIQLSLPGHPDTAVLDVGTTRTDDGLAGDVHPDVREAAGFLARCPAQRRIAAQQA